ncbi:MAG: BadF/BadG/BcrA/BcrD ATPase family protein [Bacillota bacterium]|nr:BadF/BadG/BcrA/BcrD ATPase family protein [Bacillota bacterium]
MRLVLGVDAGATKTLAAAADPAGRIRGWGRAGCGNFQVNGTGAAREVSRAVRRALAMAGAEPSHVAAAYYGMAGADRPTDFAHIHSFLEPINPASRWEVENDATIALIAATGRRVGVVVVCGTGFNCLAFHRDGTRLQVGGLGYVFGDFAGAAQVGAEVIRAATRAHDGRGPATALLDLLRQQLSVQDPSDLAAMMYEGAARPVHPGELAPLAFRAAAAGDAVATDILHRSAREMALAARVAIKRAGLDALPRIPVVLAGALLQGDPGRFLAPVIAADIDEAHPAAEVTVLDTDPVLGAVMAALQLAGSDVNEEVARTVRSSWEAMRRDRPMAAETEPGPAGERGAGAEAGAGPAGERGLKVAVVGGASTYTPELIAGLVDARDYLPMRELVLMDPDSPRLEAVGGLARRMLEDAGRGDALRLSGELDEALRGADFVIVQVRVGGMAARRLDERIPLELGCIGQETVGAGGISSALRTVPVILDISRRMERLCPGAWLINFTNPSGLVTEALYRHADVRAVGLCNVPTTMKTALAAALATTVGGRQDERFRTGGGGKAQIQLDYRGLNHLGWFMGVRDAEGRELLPVILTGHLEQVAERVNVDTDLIAAWGAIPNPYLRYYCHPDRVLAEMKASGHTRADEVIDLERRLLEIYRNPAVRRRPPELDGRGGAFYSVAAVELMLALAGIRPGEHVVSVPHEGRLADLPRDTVAELTCQVERDEITPAAAGPLPPGTAGLVRTVKECELLAIEAAVKGSRSLAYLALASHPLVPSAEVARQLLDHLLAAHRPYLPSGLQ